MTEALSQPRGVSGDKINNVTWKRGFSDNETTSGAGEIELEMRCGGAKLQVNEHGSEESGLMLRHSVPALPCCGAWPSASEPTAFPYGSQALLRKRPLLLHPPVMPRI